MDEKTIRPASGDQTGQLTTEVRQLRQSIDKFNSHAWVKVENSLPRILFRQILKGLFLGLGTVVGASVFVSVVLFFLSRIDFIPIIGEWASEVADVIEAEVDARRGGGAGGGGGQANTDGSIAPGNEEPEGSD